MNTPAIRMDESHRCNVRRSGDSVGVDGGRLPCVLEPGHAGPHRDAFGRNFTGPGHSPATPCPVLDHANPHRAAVHLTHGEMAALRVLVADLVAATDNHTFWFNRVRDTAIELQHTIDGWLEPPPR